MTTRKKTRQPARHYFRFKVEASDGVKEHVFIAKAKIIKARKAVTLILTAENVRNAIKAKGVGNTQTCALSMCAKSQAKAFPHPVEGFIDFQYRRAYVVSSIGKDGQPNKCVMYDHRSKVARLFDTKGGQQKLLEMLEKNGDQVIRLLVPESPRSRPGRPRGQNTGERSVPVSLGHGAKLRYAVAQLGGV